MTAMTACPCHAAATTASRCARVRTRPPSMTVLPLALATTWLLSGGTLWQSRASLTRRFTSAGSTSKTSWISSLMLRTPVSPLTADSAAARSLRYFTAPVSVRLPFFAVASTPSGAGALAGLEPGARYLESGTGLEHLGAALMQDGLKLTDGAGSDYGSTLIQFNRLPCHMRP
jgi:hypothetical protein